jgi:hypothetical protein
MLIPTYMNKTNMCQLQKFTYLTANMFDVVNQEDHNNPKQDNSQVTARREVGYLWNKTSRIESEQQIPIYRIQQ